ncbi:VanZ family protein [Cellulomonas endophytica]|uniref:VanZ family protein n=1 Tax=Cellulomonas endophytica TaxID=2494735 RepID=UPI0010138A88|nr:VanZ family protein [Cellulomonas endophytica]
MLATVLAQHPWTTTAALVGLVVLGPAVGAWLVGRPRVSRVLLAPAVLLVALLTLVPTRRDLDVGCTVEWSLPRLAAVEPMANLVLFVPVVLLAGVLTRRPVVVVLAASGSSLVIETVQALVPALGRSCSSNDWLHNTLGALLGALLARAGLRLAQRRRGPDRTGPR